MKTTIKLGTSSFPIEIKQKIYENGRTCLIAYEDQDSEFGVITLNISEISLKEKQIVVKTWFENRWTVQLLTLLPQHFKDTGKRVQVGFLTAPIWKFYD